MTTYLVNPSHVSFGIGVITPRWLYVLASATPEPTATRPHRRNARTARPGHHRPGDVVGIGIHTGNALRGYEIGRAARERRRLGRLRRHSRHALPRRGASSSAARTRWSPATAIRLWPMVLRDCAAGTPKPHLRRRPRSRASRSCPAAGICCRKRSYMWASVQTVRGCPKHCSFCSVWRTDGQKPRQRAVDARARRDRRAAAPRIPVHRARRRQLLSGDARRPAHGRAPRRHARSSSASRRSAPSGSS